MAKALLYELGKSASFGRLTILGKVLWPMLLAASDEQGRGLAEADVLKWSVCPNVAELTLGNIPDVLAEMVGQGMIHLYENESHGKLYQVVRWWEYPRRKARPRKFPALEGWTDRIWGKKMSGVKASSMPYEEYLATSHWKHTRQKALKRAGMICEKCRISSDDAILVVHHRTYENLGDERPEDLMVLCQRCHRLEHATGDCNA